MSDRVFARAEDRFASLIALETLGALSKRLSHDLRVHLRMCTSCLKEYDELKRISATLGIAAYRGDPDGPTSPASLKSLVLHTALAARSPKRQDADSIGDRAFVDCAPGVRWVVAGDDGITLVYRIISPPAYGSTRNEQCLSTRFGIVLEGSLMIHYADGTSQNLGVWDAYTVAAGTAYVEEFRERTLIFEMYTPKNRDYEERYERQMRLRRT